MGEVPAPDQISSARLVLDAVASEASPELHFVTALHRAISRVPAGATLLFSGGVDSSLLAFCLSELGRDPRLFTVGFPDAPDLRAAESAARTLGRPVELRLLGQEDLRSALRDGDGARPGDPEPRRSVRASLALAIELAPAGTLVCGQGADELFGGYARFRGTAPGASDRLRDASLSVLLEAEWPWTQARARQRGSTILAPYLEEEVVASGRAVPWPEGGIADVAKPRLRAIARRHGLPGELADRPKRAMQYGSGVRRALGDRG